jgi:hypothetical protein
MKLVFLLAFVGLIAATPMREEAEEYFLKDLYNNLKNEWKELKEDVKEKIDTYDFQEERIKNIGKDIVKYFENLFNEQKDIATNLYNEVKAQLKERADAILEESKDKWSTLKATLLRSKDNFLEDFETITNDALDKIVSPLKAKEGEVAASEVTGTLVEKLKKKIAQYTDVLKGDFDKYYKRIVETAAESVDDILISINSQEQPIYTAVDAAVEGIVATAINGEAEEFFLKETGQDIKEFAKKNYNVAKAFAIRQYKKIRNFLKARVDTVIEESKEIWKSLKQTAKISGKVFQDDLMDILDEALDQIFAPLPEDEDAEVPDVEIERSLSEEISYQISKRVDEFADDFDVYYKRLIDATVMAVENVKVAVNKLKVPMNEAVQDAVEEVVDVTLHG